MNKHPVVLDMLAGLARFIADCECDCMEPCDCGSHSEEYIDTVNQLYQEAGERILDEDNPEDQWEVLMDILPVLKSFDKEDSYVSN